MQRELKMETWVRSLVRRDMPDALAIERESFSVPWSEEEFLRCLRERRVIGHVAEVGEVVAGYSVHECYGEELMLLNLAVRGDCRRAGVATALLDKLKTRLSGTLRRRRVISAAVREGNLGAQLFFRARGFRCARIERGFWRDSDGAAYLFEYRPSNPIDHRNAKTID